MVSFCVDENMKLGSPHTRGEAGPSVSHFPHKHVPSSKYFLTSFLLANISPKDSNGTKDFIAFVWLL